MAFNFNTELYADPDLAEGIDWARRFRIHERFDDSPARTAEGPRTVILAPHGGGIERGTSELCLAVAGYHPANLPITPPAGVTYDYWMFEGIRPDDNKDLHVTSTGCDDLCNIVNRTLRAKGAQLELSEPLRDTMFGRNTRPGRKVTTTEVFWRFVAACRDALDRFEAEPAIVSPDVRSSPEDRCRRS